MTPLLLIAGLAMEGPRPTAFAARCVELQHDTPALTCERVARTRAAGHPVEIWQTIDPGQASDDCETPIGTTTIFVAIETHDGWYVAAAITAETGRENGHHTVGHDDLVERIGARRVKDRAVLTVRIQTTDWCERGVCDVTQTIETDDLSTSCGIGDDGLPACDDVASAPTPSRSAPRTR